MQLRGCFENRGTPKAAFGVALEVRSKLPDLSMHLGGTWRESPIPPRTHTQILGREPSFSQSVGQNWSPGYAGFSPLHLSGQAILGIWILKLPSKNRDSRPIYFRVARTNFDGWFEVPGT